MSRICILGHNGMLGHFLKKYFADLGHECVTVEKRYSVAEAEVWFDELLKLEPEWVINCASVSVKPNSSKQLHWEVNFSLPFMLAKALPDGIGLIHPSSDAVFPSRGGGPYWAEDPMAPDDDYGLAKKMAEEAVSRPFHWIIRTSLIGPEIEEPKNLFSWTLAQGNQFSGYSNHRFNGITTLEWAKIAERIMNGEFADQRLLQPATDPAIPLAELMKLIRDTWQAPAQINAIESSEPLNRIMITNTEVPFIQKQLADLYQWINTH
ncbi:MAG: sugar nucleotide-binding protein [Verrucomicrobiota bacterium]